MFGGEVDKMKDSTKDFILSFLTILMIGGFFIMFFFGLGYLILHSEGATERMYGKCIDTCERVFQEQKLIDCIYTCNSMGGINQTIGGSR